MKKLSYFFKWIFSALLLIGIGLAARIIISAYSGQLSNPIQRGNIIDAVHGYGTITTDRHFSFNPHSGQNIEKIFFKEGDIVKKGMPLMQTSSRVIIRAPFTGLVHLRPYKTGESTYATEPLIILKDITDRYILVNLENRKASRVKIGQKVKISFELLPQSFFWGEISSLLSSPNKTIVRITVANLPEQILPDMTCNVGIVIGQRENVLLIPISSFAKGYVWVRRGNSFPKKVQVAFGVTDKNWAEVLVGDIQIGDRVMVHKH